RVAAGRSRPKRSDTTMKARARGLCSRCSWLPAGPNPNDKQPRDEAVAPAYAVGVSPPSDPVIETVLDGAASGAPSPSWHPASWRTRPAAQQPPWPDPVSYKEAL